MGDWFGVGARVHSSLFIHMCSLLYECIMFTNKIVFNLKLYD